jgi:polyisoprenoid-binding protein YceI
MSTALQSQQRIGEGLWSLDPAHARIRFRVRHMGIAHMDGSFRDVSADLTVKDGQATLLGTAKTASVDSGIEQLNGHLVSPDFLDASAHPEISIELDPFTLDDEFEAHGQITIRGVSRPITVQGEVGGVIEDPYGNERLGLTLTGKINRHDFGVSWNMQLPGGGSVVSDTVTLLADLELTRS